MINDRIYDINRRYLSQKRKNRQVYEPDFANKRYEISNQHAGEPSQNRSRQNISMCGRSSLQDIENMKKAAHIIFTQIHAKQGIKTRTALHRCVV